MVGCLLTSWSAYPLILNPSFDTGDFSDWTIVTTPTGDLDASVVVFDTSQDGSDSYAARFFTGWTVFGSDGVGQGGGISQAFVSAGGTLDIVADVAAAVSVDIPNVTAGNAGSVAILVDDQLVASLVLGLVDNHTVLSVTLNGTIEVEPGEHSLAILFTRPFFRNPGIAQFVDDVRVVEVSNVPLPATGWLLLSALICIGRSRQAASPGF